MPPTLSRRRVLALSGAVATAGLAGCSTPTLEARVRGQFRHFDVSASLTHRGAETPLDLSVAVPDSELDPGDPAQIALVFQNRADGKMRIDGAPPPPFGVLQIRRISDERPLVLWTDRYIEAGGPDGGAGIITEGKWAKDVANDMGASLYIAPHETRVLLYTLHTTTRNLAAGTYTTPLLDDLYVNVQAPEAEDDYTSYGESDCLLRVQISKR